MKIGEKKAIKIIFNVNIISSNNYKTEFDYFEFNSNNGWLGFGNLFLLSVSEKLLYAKKKGL